MKRMKQLSARGLNYRLGCALILLVLQSSLLAKEKAALPEPGLKAVQQPELLPLLPASGTQIRQFSGYDPTGGNGDGVMPKTWAREYNSGGEVVFFDEYGPGCLYRQQMNIWQSKLDPQKTWIRYYFDGESKPRISMTLDQFWGRKGFTAPFVPPLQYFDDLPKNPHHRNAFDRMGVGYFPMPFAKRLQVTLSPAGQGTSQGSCWFEYTYLELPANVRVRSWTDSQKTAAVVAQWKNLGQDPEPAKHEYTESRSVRLPRMQPMEVLNLQGEGSVAALHVTLRPFNQDTFYHTTIRIYFDGQDEPAVDLPIGCFFGGGGGEFPHNDQVWNCELKTLLYGYSPARANFYSYWPMPYWKSARVVLENDCESEENPEVTVDASFKPSSTLEYPRERTGYFHARRTFDSQTNNGGAFVKSFSETGYGKVVGLAFFTDKWSCDGDEFTFIDGSCTPQIHGGGSEDDHNGAWGNDRFHQPLWGSFTRWGDFPGIQQDYRLYLNDSYVFHHDIDILYECSRLMDLKEARTESIVFYYKLDDAHCNLRQTDWVDVGNVSSEKAHDYTVTDQTWSGAVSSAYDGFEQKRDYHQATDDGRAFVGECSFSVAIDPNNDGVRLRRRLDRLGNGVQNARVFVDGKAVSERSWFVCDLSDVAENQRWRDSDFDIPARYTRGKSRIKVTVKYISSRDAKRGINEFYYWIYSFGIKPI